MFLDRLGDAITNWRRAGNRILVTSRPYALERQKRAGLGLPHAPILGLSPTLQILLVRRWFVRLKESPDLGMETAQAMIDHLHGESALDELAANPLLLTSMCVIYDQGKRLPHDKYLLYSRIVDTVLHNRFPAPEEVMPVRGRLAAVALGMHTGKGLQQEREAPEATATEGEIDRLLESYQELDGRTDKGLGDTVRAREGLLSQSGLLVSSGDGNASFYHPSFQEFLAAERLFVVQGREKKGFVELFLSRGETPGWRNTLSFLFGCVIDSLKSPHLGIDWLGDLIRHVELPAWDPSRRGQEDGIWNLAIVLGDCMRIARGRGAAAPDALDGFFERCLLEAIKQEIAITQRHTLAITLGHLGDPRIERDLRVGSRPKEHRGYVKIPAGRYLFGGEKKPFATSKPYWLSRYPVTQSQFALFIREGGYSRQEFWSQNGWRWLQKTGNTKPRHARDPDLNAPNQPVVGVSFWEAEAFSRWAGGRLPTEREWEAAARGPSGREYSWDGPWEDGICNSRETELHKPSAVGIFPRSRSVEFGVEDMVGNVWEWCHDIVEAPGRVIRGGCWFSLAKFCRPAYRYRVVPDSRTGLLGFRVAAVPSRKSSKKGKVKKKP
jgi:hypothetical protein